MAETNGIFVSALPKHTRVEDIWKVFDCDDDGKIENVLFPLDHGKSKAYVHFSQHPG